VPVLVLVGVVLLLWAAFMVWRGRRRRSDRGRLSGSGRPQLFG
jgi:hypothetical protein